MSDFLVDIVQTGLDHRMDAMGISPERTLASFTRAGAPDVVLRDHPVLTLTNAPPDEPAGSIRVVLRGQIPLIPHVEGFIRAEGRVEHDGIGHVTAVRLTAGTIDVKIENEGVWIFKAGVHLEDESGSDLTLGLHGGITLLLLGTTFDCVVVANGEGLMVEGTLSLPVSVPLAFTAGVIGANGLMFLVAEDFAPRIEDDDSAGTIECPANANDYVKWATGPFLDHPEDAWVAREGWSGFGVGAVLQSFPDHGKLLELNPAGLVTLAGPDGLVLLAGAAGEALNSKSFEASAFLCWVQGQSVAIGAEVKVKVEAAPEGGAHQTARAPTPVAPGASPPGSADAELGGGSVFRGEGKLDIYIPYAPGAGAGHFEIGTPHEPLALEFLRGLCQIEFYLVVDWASGSSCGLLAAFGFHLGSDDSIIELSAHAALGVVIANALAPQVSFTEGRLYLEARIRVLFIKIGFAVGVDFVGMTRPQEAIADLYAYVELPWPLPSVGPFHTDLTLLDSPVQPQFNPPMLVGTYQIGVE